MCGAISNCIADNIFKRHPQQILVNPRGTVVLCFQNQALIAFIRQWGVWMMWKRQPAMALAILMIALVNIGFFPTSRYRLLAYPLICIGIAGIAMRRKILVPLTLGAILAIGGHWMAGRVVDYPAWRAFAYTEAGRRQLVQNDIDAARDWFDQALTERPILPALMDRGILAFEMDSDPGFASELFAEALLLEPDYPDPHFYLGVIALATQQLNTAQQSFQAYLTARQRVGYEDNVDTEMLARSLLYFILLETRSGPTEAAEQAWQRACSLIDVPEELRERINALESRFPDNSHQ